MQPLLTGTNNTTDAPPEQQNDVENEDEGTPNEEDSSPLAFGYFLDIIFQANFETVVGPQPSFGETLVSFGGFVPLFDFNTLVEVGAPRRS